MKALLVLAMVLLSPLPGHARGIYFQIKGDPRIAETTRIVSRCMPALEARETKNGQKLVTCRPANGGHLVGLMDGRGVRLRFFTSTGTLAWQRVIDGIIAFADEMMLVFESPGGYRVVWLAEKDGRTTRDVRFRKLSKRDTPQDDFRCGDLVDQWLRSNEKPARLAQVCTVLD
ncbi:MAG: hypothetical protein M4D80_10005 [Myxococcota bacterium]|nr:hypothetical protein [Myxococcota bacterium]